MTNEERDIITQFIGRVSGAQPSGGLTGSVPGVTPALPPVDPEADRLIADLFTRYPDARYRLTQTAFVQEHALVEAQNRIKRLEYELQQAQQASQAPAPAPSRGFLGGLFGGGQAPQPQPQYQQPQYQPPPPQPQYAPSYQPGMFQRSGGSGFLGSALTTAAGVAGGLVAGNALMSLFSGDHHGGGDSGFGGGGERGFGGSPWGGADQGSAWDNQTSSADPGTGSGWDNVVNQPDPSGGGWDNGSSGIDDQSGGGFDSGSGFDDNT